MMPALFFMALFACFASAQNPGHHAEQIGSGTFAGPGGYVFPGIVSINGALSISASILNPGSNPVVINDALNVRQNTVVDGNIYANTLGVGGTPIIAVAVGNTNTGLDSGGGGIMYVKQNNNPLMIFSGGRVGVNIVGSVPQAHFDVNGTVRAQEYCFANGNCINTNWPGGSSGGGWVKTGNRVYLETASNSVGVGTDTPTVKFHVVDGDLKVENEFGRYISLNNVGANGIISTNTNVLLFGDGMSGTTFRFLGPVETSASRDISSGNNVIASGNVNAGNNVNAVNDVVVGNDLVLGNVLKSSGGDVIIQLG